MTPSARATVDLVAGVLAVGWAVAAMFLPQLAKLASAEVAGGFGFLALARGYAELKGGDEGEKPNEDEKPDPDKPVRRNG